MTLRVIIGVLPQEARVTAGQIRLDGVDLTQLDTAQLNKIRGPRIAMIFQEPMTALNPVMRVGAQIAEAIHAHESKLPREEVDRRVLTTLERVTVPNPELRARQYPHQLSGGLRQRVMI